MGPVHALDYDRSVKKQSLLQRRRIPTAALVKAARKGDKGAFIRLHEAYCGAVRSVAWGGSSDGGDKRRGDP